MKDGTREEYEFLRTKEHEFNTMTADRILREQSVITQTPTGSSLHYYTT